MRRALSKTYGAAEQLLLDEYPTAAVAYSLRDLSTASVGSAVVRVRRSSDNTEQDFTATEITDGTLETFVGTGNDGFVTTLYDQSGNLQNISQNSAVNQGKIVDSGSLLTKEGKPTVNTIASYNRGTTSNYLDYYTNTDTFTFTLHTLDGNLTNNNDVFIDNAGGAHQSRTGFSFSVNYAGVNYPASTNISSINYDRNLIQDIYQVLIWESYPSNTDVNERLKLYNNNGLLADGNTSNNPPTGQGSNRYDAYFGAEAAGYLAPVGLWQETVLYKESNIPNRSNFINSIQQYYTF